MSDFQRFLSLVVLFLSVTLLFSGTGKSFAYAASKVFVYCSEASPSSFGPALVSDGTSMNASAQIIYDRLVEFKPGTTEIIPGLAEKWSISPNGLKYTFTLRKGVKWHSTDFFKPTRDFNADDVLFSINRQRLKDHPYHKVGGGNYEYFESMDMASIIKDVRKISSEQIEFILARPEAPFLANLAMDFASVYSAEYADQLTKAKTPEKIDQFPVGTGPFVFSQYVKDTLIRYQAHSNYYRGKSPLDKVVFAITPDPSVRLQKLKAGECHLMTEPAPADLETLRKDSKLSVTSLPGMNIAYLAFNVKKKPFDDVRVRKAIHYALNRQSYIDAIYLGGAVVAKNPFPPSVWSYDQKTVDYDYNLEKAKTLLKEAGFPKGFSTDLWAMPVSRPYNPNGKKMAEMMQADLAKIGIQARIVSYDWPTYLAKTKAAEHSLLQFGWTGDNGDPDNFLYVNLSCAAVEGAGNRAFWCHSPFDALLKKGKEATHKNERVKAYLAAQKLFKEEVPWVTLAHSTVYRAMSKKVKGFIMSPLGHDYFYGVDLE